MKQVTVPRPPQLSKKDRIMGKKSRLSFHGRKKVTKYGMQKSVAAKCLNIHWKELAQYTSLHLHYLGITLKSNTKLT